MFKPITLSSLLLLFSAGAFAQAGPWQFSGGSSSGAVSSTKQVGNNFYLTGYGGKIDGHHVVDAVTTGTNTSGVVTSATAHFQGTVNGTPIAKVGQDVYVLAAGASVTTGTGCPNGFGQIQSIDSDSQITINCFQANAGSGRTLFWGTNDDAAWVAADADILASGMCNVTLVVPAGESRVTQGHNWNYTASCQNNDGSVGGVTLSGSGIKSSLIVIGPDYDYTHSWGNITYYPKDIQFTGLSLISNNGASKTLVSSSGAGLPTAFAVSQLNKGIAFTPVNFGSTGGGCINCFFDQLPSINASANNTGFIGTFSGSGVQANANVLSIQGGWGQTAGPGMDCIGASSSIVSNQDTFYNVTGVLAAVRVSNAGCKVIMSQGNFSALTTVVSFSFSANGTASVRDSQLGGNSASGAIFDSAASTATFIDMGGNTFACSGCTNPLQGYTSGIWSGPGNGNTIYTACTGTATASSTLSMRISGISTATTAVPTTCSSTTIDAGRPMNRAGHISGLIVTAGTGGVNASSGVFTVLLNGSTTVFTCTMGTATTCRDVAHAPVATAIGDLISIQFTTQASETLANVKATIIETN